MTCTNFGKPQKALHLHLDEAKVTPGHIGKTYAVMEKFDGWYMYVDFIDGVPQKIRSKTGRILPSMEYYNRELEAGPRPNSDIRIIFEATIDGMIFQELNGQFNQRKSELKNAVLRVHDLLLLKYPHSPFSKRYTRVKQFVSFLDQEWLKAVDIFDITDDSKRFHEIYNTVVHYGGEGVILKDVNAVYSPNARIASLLKIKCELTLDLTVIGVLEGAVGSKYEGTLGKIVVQEKSGQTHSVSGMSDAERDMWWKDRSLIIGKVVEIQAMKRLPNGSLREPRFKAIRHDKLLTDID